MILRNKTTHSTHTNAQENAQKSTHTPKTHTPSTHTCNNNNNQKNTYSYFYTYGTISGHSPHPPTSVWVGWVFFSFRCFLPHQCPLVCKTCNTFFCNWWFWKCDPHRIHGFCTRVGLAILESQSIDEYKTQSASVIVILGNKNLTPHTHQCSRKCPKKHSHTKHTHPFAKVWGKLMHTTTSTTKKTPIPTSTHMGQSFALAPILPLVCVIRFYQSYPCFC